MERERHKVERKQKSIIIVRFPMLFAQYVRFNPVIEKTIQNLHEKEKLNIMQH